MKRASDKRGASVTRKQLLAAAASAKNWPSHWAT